MEILDRFGVKEVADLVFYEIDPKNPNQLGPPVLFLDSLKMSTLNFSTENSEARGGKGNAPLLAWDHNKNIEFEVSDALFSIKSLSVILGGENSKHKKEWNKLFFKNQLSEEVDASSKTAKVKFKGVTLVLTDCQFFKVLDSQIVEINNGKDYDYVLGKISFNSAKEIVIDSDTFPGTYCVIGMTYARDEITGKDQLFQFMIPKAKIFCDSFTLALEADGEPAVFNFKIKALAERRGRIMSFLLGKTDCIQLPAPSLSIENDQLIIVDSSKFATAFDLYVNDQIINILVQEPEEEANLVLADGKTLYTLDGKIFVAGGQ